jgi:LEA14-like dessication related protein
MKNKTFLFIGLATAAVIYLLTKKSAAKNLKVYFNSLKLDKSKGIAIPTVKASFRIVNPTSSSLSVDSIAGDIYINNKQLSSVSNTDKFTIPANSESYYDVNVKTGIFTALQTIYSLLKDKKRMSVTFDGAINSGGFLLPIKETIIQF